MFSQEYQGGENGIEVFSASGKSPGKQWKVSSSVHRVYDKTVKGFVFLLDKKTTASSSAMMQIPPSPSKQTLGLTQRHLVLQLRLLAKKPFTLEINILSLKDKRQRYRLHLSNKFRTVEVHQMHVQIPLAPLLTPDTWTHLIIDAAHLTSYFFKNRDFGSIDSIHIHSGCRLRKIFTLPALKRGEVSDFERGEEIERFYFHCPHQYDFPVGTTYEAKVLDVSCFEGKGTYSIEENGDVVSTKQSDTKSQSRKSQTPVIKSGSKNTQPEAFEDATPSGDQTSEAKHSQGNQDGSTTLQDGKHDAKNIERKRKSDNPESKKHLMALNSRRQQHLEQQHIEHEQVPPPALPLQQPTITTNNTTASRVASIIADKPTSLHEALTPLSSPLRQPPVPPKIEAMMMSVENALPKPQSPITSQSTRVFATEFIWAPTHGINSPPRNTIVGKIESEETLQEQSRQEESVEFENGSWIEAITSQDSGLQNSTVFNFASSAMKIESVREDDMRSESTASFSFDREEELKEESGVSDEVGDENIRSLEKDVKQNSLSGIVQCVSPVRVSRVGHDTSRDSDDVPGHSPGRYDCHDRTLFSPTHDDSPEMTRSREQWDLQVLKEHFRDLIFEFEEEYGEGEATRFLRL